MYLYRYILTFFCFLSVSCGSVIQDVFVEESVQTLPYAIGGARVVFQLPNSFLEAICTTKIVDTGVEQTLVPTYPYDRKSVTCRLPDFVSSGKVDVTLESFEATGTYLHKVSYLLYPEPVQELVVTEDWTNSQLRLTWNKTYFTQYVPPTAPIILEAAFYLSENGTEKFVQRESIPLFGNNTQGSAVVSLNDNILNALSQYRYPYYYVLRQIATLSDVYLASEFFTPTFNKTTEDAKNICNNWLQTAQEPSQLDPCPNCLCKLNVDTSFKLSKFHPQILKLSGTELNNHVLYYQTTSSAEGHAQTCSYNRGTNALAVKSPAQASWAHFVSRDDSYVRNYVSDIWPYIVCCLETNEQEICDLFHQKRPVDDGSRYPGADEPCYGTVDPHMKTFDGVNYDFQGYGEFWLIHGPDGDGAQARMGPIGSNQGVTYYKALAIKQGKTLLEIRGTTSRTFQILLNGRDYISIPRTVVVLPLPGITLTLQGTNQITVHMESGFNIQARIVSSASETFLNLYGGGAQKSKGKGYMGIFGNFDGNRTNDLTSRSGIFIEPTPSNLRNLSLIHNQFGLTWMIKPEESFFTYENGTSWETFNKPDFGPILEYPDPASFPENIRAICKDSLACYYEYFATGEAEAGEAVVEDEENAEKIKEEVDKVILQCEDPQSPQNGSVKWEGKLNGSEAIYSCDTEYELTGAATRECKEVANNTYWDGQIPTCLWTCVLCTEEVGYQLTHDPSDCNKYFYCVQGQRFSLYCPPEEAFSPETLLCDKEYKCTGQPGCHQKI